MIPVYQIVLFYIFGFITLTLPMILVLILKIKCDVKLLKYALLPIGAYIILEIILVPFLVQLTLSTIQPVDDILNLYSYWMENIPYGYIVITSFITSVIPLMIIFLTFKLILKDVRIYDVISFGIFYSLVEGLYSAISTSSLASIAIHFNNNTLNDLVNEANPLSTLNDNIQIIQTYGAMPAAVDFIHFFEITAACVFALILFFHVLKTKKYWMLGISLFGYFAAWYLPQLFTLLVPNNYWVSFFVVFSLFLFFLASDILYIRWYLKEKEKYKAQLNEYKERLKTL